MEQNDAHLGQGAAPESNTPSDANNNNMESLLNQEGLTLDFPQAGEIRDGVIASLSPTQILVSVGAKSEGVITGRELEAIPAETREAFTVGQEILVYVLSAEDSSGNVVLSFTRAQEQKGWAEVEKMLEESQSYQGNIDGFNKGGIIVPDEAYILGAADLCRSRGVLLILDEIQTGAGRTGRFLASHSEGIRYDIVNLGKGLAGGIPIGVTLVSREVGEKIPRAAHTSTFGGNPLASAGALAVLELLDESRLAHVRDIGRYFLENLRLVSSPLISAVRGKGLMLGIEVNARRDDILKELQREKVLAIPAGDNVVRFLPPYIIEKKHVDEALQKIGKVFSDLS